LRNHLLIVQQFLNKCLSDFRTFRRTKYSISLLKYICAIQKNQTVDVILLTSLRICPKPFLAIYSDLYFRKSCGRGGLCLYKSIDDQIQWLCRQDNNYADAPDRISECCAIGCFAKAHAGLGTPVPQTPRACGQHQSLTPHPLHPRQRRRRLHRQIARASCHWNVCREHKPLGYRNQTCWR
jgi:hypothetical protein